MGSICGPAYRLRQRSLFSRLSLPMAHTLGTLTLLRMVIDIIDPEANIPAASFIRRSIIRRLLSAIPPRCPGNISPNLRKNQFKRKRQVF